MDRERLKEVHQSDLTEGRINQDFLDWLQTKGTTYLLIALVGLIVYMGILRWKNHQTENQTKAWTDFSVAAIPKAFEDVAENYPDVGSLAHLARLRAGAALLAAVQTGKPIGAEGPEPKELTDEERTQYLKRADGLYEQVTKADDQSTEKALLVATALTGRAAVAESLGQADQAKQFYTKAADRVQTLFPKLAEQARKRAESAEAESKPVVLMSKADWSQLQLKNGGTIPKLEQINMDPWIRELLFPAEATN